MHSYTHSFTHSHTHLLTHSHTQCVVLQSTTRAFEANTAFFLVLSGLSTALQLREPAPEGDDAIYDTEQVKVMHCSV